MTRRTRRVASRVDPDSSDLIDLGFAAGLSAVGVTSAEVFADTRAVLADRKRRSLHGSMQFTYRNPERSTDPGRILPGARSLVVGAWSYRQSARPDHDDEAGSGSTSRSDPHPAARSRPSGSVARYARSDHYGALRRALGRIADRLRMDGNRAVVVCDDNALVDRAAAHRAGLGFYGKNCMLLLPGLGSWFVLGTVVTDASLDQRAAATAGPGGGIPVTDGGAPTALGRPAPLPDASDCGRCTRCLSACPTGALVAPGVLDARRCLAWLVQDSAPIPIELRPALGGRFYGCDECQRVCPINLIADRRRPPPPGDDDVRSVDLLDILEKSDESLMGAYGRWYVAERNPRYLRRNALVALGNVGDPTDGDTRQALLRWTESGDPMLAEHARWAVARLGCDNRARVAPSAIRPPTSR